MTSERHCDAAVARKPPARPRNHPEENLMSGNYPPNQPPSGGYPPPPPGGNPPPPGGYPPPPPGGYSPPGSGYPPQGGQYTVPPQPGSYGAPPPKKGNTLLLVLGGCATLIIIGVIGFFVVSYVVYHKAKQAAKDAGLDTELIQKRPALAAAKAVIAMNKDLELVSSDDEKGMLTVRDKQTGEVITISADDANKGKLSFKQSGKDLGSLQVNTDNPSIEVKSDKGSAALGPGVKDTPPEWIPVYPGTELGWDYAVRDKNNVPQNGSFHFLTRDDPNKILNFYSDGLRRAGLTVTGTEIPTGGGSIPGGVPGGIPGSSTVGKIGVLNAYQDSPPRQIYLSVTPQSGAGNMVSIVFNSGS